MMTSLSKAGLLVLWIAFFGLAGCGSASEEATLTFSVVSEENQGDRIARYEGFRRVLSEALGMEVKMHIATDYAGTVEAMRVGSVDLAFLGASAYALAYDVTGGGVEPLVSYRDNSGKTGYHSVVAVKTESAFQSLEDLKGRTIAFPDPNSTSGFLVPNFYFRKQGIVPDEYFSRTGFSGNHENGILAVVNETYDAATTYWNNEEFGNIQRMTEKGMIEEGAVRIIWTSPLIPNEPWTVRKDVAPEIKQTIAQVLKTLEETDPAAWQELTDGKVETYVDATHADYVDIIEMRETMLSNRRE